MDREDFKESQYFSINLNVYFIGKLISVSNANRRLCLSTLG